MAELHPHPLRTGPCCTRLHGRDEVPRPHHADRQRVSRVAVVFTASDD